MKDRLDEAIDRVAARMTHVNDDPALASRIAAALPERAGGAWLWLRPRLAITAALAGAIAMIVLRSFDDRAADVLRSENAHPAMIEFAGAVARGTRVEPSLNVRRIPVERSSNAGSTFVEPLLNDGRTTADHEFSLAPIAAVEALSLKFLAPEALPVEDALVVAPLAIADLTEDDPVFPRR